MAVFYTLTNRRQYEVVDRNGVIQHVPINGATSVEECDGHRLALAKHVLSAAISVYEYEENVKRAAKHHAGLGLLDMLGQQGGHGPLGEAN